MFFAWKLCFIFSFFVKIYLCKIVKGDQLQSLYKNLFYKLCFLRYLCCVLKGRTNGIINIRASYAAWSQCDQTTTKEFKIGPFTAMKMCPRAKIGFKILPNSLKYFQKLLKMNQSGKISQNLDTLIAAILKIAKSSINCKKSEIVLTYRAEIRILKSI